MFFRRGNRRKSLKSFGRGGTGDGEWSEGIRFGCRAEGRRCRIGSRGQISRQSRQVGLGTGIMNTRVGLFVRLG